MTAARIAPQQPPESTMRQLAPSAPDGVHRLDREGGLTMEVVTLDSPGWFDSIGSRWSRREP